MIESLLVAVSKRSFLLGVSVSHKTLGDCRSLDASPEHNVAASPILAAPNSLAFRIYSPPGQTK